MLIRVTSTKEIGVWARKTRKAQQLDQVTAGSLAGSGLTFVSQFENGKPTVQLEKALQMLETLGLHVYLDVPESVTETESEQ
ncbi:MAG: transcriptional regulator [Pseudomonadota bacterium]